MSGRRAAQRHGHPIAQNPTAWDEVLLANGGHFLQSWRWGVFKDQFGWETERIAATGTSGVALAQILFRHKAGVSIGYIPRGPALPPDDPEAASNLWQGIDKAARRRRALTIILEPDAPMEETLVRRQRLRPGPDPIQPSRTVKVPLRDDEALLQKMHQKTRYNVRLAMRRGVTCRSVAATDDAVSQFYALLEDTSNRNEFGIHSESYYHEFLRIFGGSATLMFADIEDKPAAGVIAVAHGEEAIYMYGGSSTKERAHGAGFLIQYEVMRWARERGCRRYDMWGIPHHDPESTVRENGDRIAGSTGSDWRGLYEFKTRFGGDIVNYPEPLEKPYRPLLASMARRIYRTRAEQA